MSVSTDKWLFFRMQSVRRLPLILGLSHFRLHCYVYDANLDLLCSTKTLMMTILPVPRPCRQISMEQALGEVALHL